MCQEYSVHFFTQLDLFGLDSRPKSYSGLINQQLGAVLPISFPEILDFQVDRLVECQPSHGTAALRANGEAAVSIRQCVYVICEKKRNRISVFELCPPVDLRSRWRTNGCAALNMNTKDQA